MHAICMLYIEVMDERVYDHAPHLTGSIRIVLSKMMLIEHMNNLYTQ